MPGYSEGRPIWTALCLSIPQNRFGPIQSVEHPAFSVQRRTRGKDRCRLHLIAVLLQQGAILCGHLADPFFSVIAPQMLQRGLGKCRRLHSTLRRGWHWGSAQGRAFLLKKLADSLFLPPSYSLAYHILPPLVSVLRIFPTNVQAAARPGYVFSANHAMPRRWLQDSAQGFNPGNQPPSDAP
jgi:hypothetical protein